MKMTTAAAAAVAGLLLCCFASSDPADACDVNGITGGNATLKLQHKLTGAQMLKWTRGNEVIFERVSETLIVRKERDILKDGSLWLQNLTKREAGKYKPEVFEDGQSKGNLKAISLCVLDPVPKPRVNQMCQGKKVTFVCSVIKPPSDAKFKWLQNGEAVAKQTGNTWKPSSDELARGGKFTCVIHNSVSNETAEPVSYTCGEEPGFVFPKELLGINTWIIVGVGGGVVLLLIVLVLVCCIRNRRRQRMQIKDEMELRLDWAGSGQQHANQHRCRPPGQQQHPNHHHPPHHHHQQQQPAGHTGPRQHRPKGQPRPKAPEVPGGHPQPSPRRPAQGPRPVPDNEEQPPPLPQPRKKAPRATKA